MITPLDIQNKEFTRSVRGYKEEEVDMFLDLITLDLEKIVKENVRLKAEIAALNDDLEKYKGSEGEIVAVLEKAQSLMNDISASSEKRADVIIKNAELDADLTVREAREQAVKLVSEHKNLQKRFNSFRDRYKKMLEDELARFSSDDMDLEQDLGDHKLEDLLGEDFVSVKESPEKQKVPDEIEVTSMDDLKDIEDAPDIEINDQADDRKTVIVDLSHRDGE